MSVLDSRHNQSMSFVPRAFVEIEKIHSPLQAGLTTPSWDAGSSPDDGRRNNKGSWGPVARELAAWLAHWPDGRCDICLWPPLPGSLQHKLSKCKLQIAWPSACGTKCAHNFKFITNLRAMRYERKSRHTCKKNSESYLA